MLLIVGAVVVLAGCGIGYAMEHGNWGILFQPAEVFIIWGAALGAFIISSSKKTIGIVIHGIKGVFSAQPYKKEDYTELLSLMHNIFSKIRKEGLKALENELDKPHDSALFKQYPRFHSNHHAVSILTDIFRTILTTKLKPSQLDALLDAEIAGYHEELMIPAKKVNTISDGMPGLGIVAAVLGVIITMQKIGSPPAEIGHSIGAALVGTFLGILTCYGFMGPLSQNMETAAMEEKEYLIVLKTILVAFSAGIHPQICVEFGRMMVPEGERPSFMDLEKTLKERKAASGKKGEGEEE
jgi:chemotaxis protein MotA